MKKQIIIVGSVLLAALLLFGVYLIFLRPDDNVVTDDPFYKLSEPVLEKVSLLTQSTDIVLTGVTDGTLTSDESIGRIYKFAQSFAAANKKISVKTDSSGEQAVVVKGKEGERIIPFADFYKTLSDGTRYAFDGERLLADAVLTLAGASVPGGIALRALPGYDTDGDTVAGSGRPFMYPNIQRNQVYALDVVRDKGNDNFRVYQGENGKFYFHGAELVAYDPEKFSQLIVGATYTLSMGKVSNPLSFKEYGLEDDKTTATAIVTLLTTEKNAHRIIIGSETPSGTGYYARYVGKDHVYILPATDVQAAFLAPVASFLQANLVYSIPSPNEVYNIGTITLQYPQKGLTMTALPYSNLMTSSNLGVYGKTELKNVLTDKKQSTGAYTVWTDITSLGGFGSADGKDIWMEVYPVNHGKNGKYTVSFGLLRDETAAAVLPSSYKISYTTDGATYTDLENLPDSFSQSAGEVKRYSFDFQSDKPVTAVRMTIGVAKGKYVVMDEFNVKVDGVDAHPNEGVTGGWRIISPTSYLPEGKNFIYPNLIFPSDFVIPFATLTGTRVVDYAITKTQGDPTTLNTEKLAKYGLAEPERILSYEYKGITTTLYVSEKNQAGNYYAYAVIAGEAEGEKLHLTSDVIVEITNEKNGWLEWELIEFFESALIAIHIDSINSMEVDFGGNNYVFTLHKTDAGVVDRVTVSGGGHDNMEVDLTSFRRFYTTILRANIKGEYEPGEGEPAQTLRIKVNALASSPEYIFYRVTTGKAYYTVDGQGQYYVLMDRVNLIKTNLGLLLEGKEVTN